MQRSYIANYLPRLKVWYCMGDFRVHKISLISDTFLLIVGWNSDKTSWSTDTNFCSLGTTANLYSIVIRKNTNAIIIRRLWKSFLFCFPLWFDPPSFDRKFWFNHSLQQLIFISGNHQNVHWIPFSNCFSSWIYSYQHVE